MNMDMEAAEKKRSPQAWKLRLPWEQQKQAEIQRSAFIQSQEKARASTSSVSTIARAFMISRRRLRLDPDKKLHFLCKLFADGAAASASGFSFVSLQF